MPGFGEALNVSCHFHLHHSPMRYLVELESEPQQTGLGLHSWNSIIAGTPFGDPLLGLSETGVLSGVSERAGGLLW